MLLRILLLIILMSLSLVNAGVMTQTETEITFKPDQNNQVIQTPYVDVKKIVDIFLMAVELGELQVLDLTIEKKSLVPIQVELIYQLDLHDPEIKILSNVVPPIPLPHVGTMCITKVSATMNLYGKIIDSTAHCEY